MGVAVAAGGYFATSYSLSAPDKFLKPRFARESVPTERADNFRMIVAAFATTRSDREFVRQIRFTSPTQVLLWFSDGGDHGGGTMTLRKKGSVWTIAEKSWFM